MDAFVALLRGINVGGRNKVPMAELRSVLSSLGLEGVATYIQSGNVVFRSPTDDERELAGRIEKVISKAFGVDSTVLLRTPTELAEVADRNPFAKAGADVSKLHILFLDGPPAGDAVEELDPGRSPPDEFSVGEREVYLHLPNGMGRTKLTADYFERRLGVRGTARNWNTVTKLLELSRSAG